jgi:hypothetical protein
MAASGHHQHGLLTDATFDPLARVPGDGAAFKRRLDAVLE